MAKKENDIRKYIPAEDPYHEPIPVDRRRRRDALSRVIAWISATSWGIAVFAIGFLALAQPNSEVGATFRIAYDKSIDMPLVEISFYLMVFAGLLCIIGLIFNFFRHKRKTDRFSKSLIIMGVISIICAVAIRLIFG